MVDATIGSIFELKECLKKLLDSAIPDISRASGLTYNALRIGKCKKRSSAEDMSSIKIPAVACLTI